MRECINILTFTEAKSKPLFESDKGKTLHKNVINRPKIGKKENKKGKIQVKKIPK